MLVQILQAFWEQMQVFEGNETHDSSSEVEEVPSTREIINITAVLKSRPWKDAFF